MSQRILITGANGLIGRALCTGLTAQGWHIQRLVRGTPEISEDIPWNPDARRLDPHRLEGLRAVIHLAGANIAARRWDTRYKKTIFDSRVGPTAFLSQTLAGLTTPPEVLICASAVGIYGPRSPDETVDEDTPPGPGFLADVCQAWESAAAPAQAAGLRVIHARFGMVLAKEGGALAKMLPAFRFGLGGPVGTGRQMLSWIPLAELPAVFAHLLNSVQLRGPVNICAPQSLSNADFTRTLANTLHRPAFLPLPSVVVRLLFGEMGQALLLDGAAARPSRLQASGYTFQTPTLDEALKRLFS